MRNKVPGSLGAYGVHARFVQSGQRCIISALNDAAQVANVERNERHRGSLGALLISRCLGRDAWKVRVVQSVLAQTPNERISVQTCLVRLGEQGLRPICGVVWDSE